MGVLMVGRRPPATHLAAFLLATIAFSCLRRRVEQDVPGWEARPSLRKWSPGALNRVLFGAVVMLLALAIWKAPTAPGFYGALVGTAGVLIGGAYASPEIRRLFALDLDPLTPSRRPNQHDGNDRDRRERADSRCAAGARAGDPERHEVVYGPWSD